MIQPSLLTAPPSKVTLAEKLAAYFTARPNRWIDARELFPIAGSMAWRTRLSELRRAPFSMQIDNKVRTTIGQDGTRLTHSYYRYVPAQKEIA